ncbi:MAG: hypothetical protein ACREBB_06900 [Nitrosotalea sp.]
MKLIPVMISIILASSTLGYGIQASAQVGGGVAGAGGGTPCSASYPCAAICGDHPCAPGEVYTPGLPNATASKPASGTNGTGSSAVATQVSIGANVTATKTVNGTVMHSQTMTNMASAKTNGTMTNMASAKTNGTMTNAGGTTTTTPHMNANSTAPSATTPSTSTTLPSPEAQIVAGAQPANVKCPSGLYLVLNNIDSRPACVTQNTMSALENRGWGHAAP